MLNSLEQLKGKQVGIRTGMPYGNAYRAAGLQSQAKNSIANNIRKVMRGRIDAFLGYAPDVWGFFDELNIKPLPHDAANPVAVHRDSILYRDTVATRVFVGKLDAAIKQMELAGEL